DATSQGAGHVYAGGAPYNVSLGSVIGTYYFDVDTTFDSAIPKNYVNGAVVVMGNFTIKGNSSAQAGSLSVNLPTTAWREYGNNWSYYKSNWDLGAPPWPGQNGNYDPGVVPEFLSNLSVNGFVYVGGTFSINGGGNAAI